MATYGRLYEIARAPVKGKGWFNSIPSLPDFSDEYHLVKDNAVIYFNNACDLVEEHLPDEFKNNYSAYEDQIGVWLACIGLGHIPPRLVIKSVAVFVIISFCVFSYVSKVKRRRRHKMLYGNNTFPPYARAGTMKTISAMISNSKSPWFFKQCSDEIKSSVFRLRLPFVKAPMLVAVGDLVTVKEILQDPGTIKTESHFTSIGSVAGGGPNIVTSEGPQWKRSRKAVSPAFMKKHLDRMHHICREETEDWINNKLKRFVDKDKDFDIGKEMMRLTLSILCKAAFDYEMDPKENSAIAAELAIVSKEFGFDEMNRPMRVRFGILSSSTRRARLARTRMLDFGKKVLYSYRKKRKAENSTAVSPNETILSCIVKSKKYADDTRRIADIVMFLFVGVENTAYSLAWTMFELARNPRVASELNSALSGNNDQRAQEMLKDVLREGMRLRPPMPGIGIRTVGRDFYMKDMSIVIPKGSQVIFPSLVLTRFDVEDAESFRPSRWRDHPDKSFLLFSTGRRNCVGQSLALAEITWVLSRLCAKFEFDVVDEGSVDYCGTMKCIGTRLKATPKQKKVL
jgi:cytochrome P450